MIYDDICNIDEYAGLSPGLDIAIRYLRAGNLASLPEGKATIEGDSVYAIVSRPTTRHSEGVEFEFHERFLDVHVLLEGEERLLVSGRTALRLVQEYDKAKDFGLMSGKAEADMLMTAGKFCVCFPADAHAPLVACGSPAVIRKAVIKVEINRERKDR